MVKPRILRFVDAFVGDVFGDKRENLHMRARTANLVFDVRFARIESPCQTAADVDCLSLIVHELHSPEHDNATA